VAQVPLLLARLMRQLIAQKRMLHLILAACRLAETLGGASFRLHLWHNGLENKVRIQAAGLLETSDVPGWRR
jgi:hypothetical protein